VDLKEPPEPPESPERAESAEGRTLVERLGRVFGNLREVAQSPDPATADALIEPVLDHFRDTLEAVAVARPDLAPKCSDLQHRLCRFLEPPGEPGEGSDEAMGSDCEL